MSDNATGTSNSNSNENAVVALIDPELAVSSKSFAASSTCNASQQGCQSVVLADPADASCERQYLVTKEKTICELQSLAPASGYGSFLVNGGYCVGNGNLYTVTRTDPLFWFLTDTAADKQQQQQWQPLEQILADKHLCETVVNAVMVDATQLRHLFATMQLPGSNNNNSDDECYYKFCVEKAITWLVQKQERVQAALWLQQESAVAANNNDNKLLDAADETAADTGAFSSSFHLSADLQKENQAQLSGSAAAESPEDKQKHLQKQCRHESVQIVCTYLNASWRQRFLQHLKLNENILLSPKKRQEKQKKAAQSSTNAGETVAKGMPAVTAVIDLNDMNKPVVKKQKVQPAVSMGVKRLAKVNTKGMQKMSSFFGAKPKAAKKKAKDSSE